MFGRSVIESVMVPAAALVCAAGCAFAQVADVRPFYAVSTERANLRCGDSDRFYKSGEIAPNTVVLVDGEGQNWSRVSYPGGSSAFVRAEDVQVEGTTLRLTQASKLKAANLASGYGGSWKSLLAAALPAGTTLRLIEPAKEETGALVGYRVAMPDVARAYVESRVLRRATEAEIVQYKAQPGAVTAADAEGGAGGTAPGSAPAGATPRIVPAPAAPTGAPSTPGTQPGSTPGAVPATTRPVIDMTEPLVTGTPAAGEAPTGEVRGTGQPVETIEQVTPRVGDRGESTPRTGSVEELEGTFKQVWSQPILTAEVDELAAEYRRALDAQAADSPRRKGLQQRVDALEARTAYRDTVRRQEDALARLDSQKVRMAEQLAEIERTRVYTIIGQLQPSTVYDGKRLPQMYRVVSVGGTSPRTLGYLKASEELDLDKKLGLVVGVIGQANVDRSLKLNVIDPVRVDVLKSSGGEALRPSAGRATDASEPTRPAATRPAPVRGTSPGLVPARPARPAPVEELPPSEQTGGDE